MHAMSFMSILSIIFFSLTAVINSQASVRILDYYYQLLK